MVELQFLYKSLRLTFFLSLFLGAFLIYYYGSNVGLGFICGSFWNIFNFVVLIRLIRSVFEPSKRKRLKIFFFCILKFGLLYIIGFVIIKHSHLSLSGMLAGFSLLFLVLFLKTLGRVFYERTNGFCCSRKR